MKKIAFIIACLATAACAQLPEGPVMFSFRTSGNPMTDVSVWDAAAPIIMEDSLKSDNSTAVRSLWDGDSLYIRFDVKDTKLWSTVTEKDSDHLYLDDMCEFLLDTRYDRTEQWIEDDIIYHINILGQKKDDRGTPEGGPDKTWDGVARYVITLDGTLNDNSDVDNGYSITVAVPWTEIGQRAARGLKMGINLGVDDKEDDHENRSIVFLCNCKPTRKPSEFGTLILK